MRCVTFIGIWLSLVIAVFIGDQQDVTCGVKYNMKEPKNLKFDETQVGLNVTFSFYINVNVQMLWQKRFEQGTV